MKRIYSLLITVLAVVSAWSQNTYTWNGVNNASWQTPSNWVPDRTTPATNDLLIINTTLTITNIPTQTIGRLTIDAGSTVTFVPSNAANILTISNTTAPAFVVNGDLITGINISLGDNVDGTIAGTMTINNVSRTFTTGGVGSNTFVTGTIDNKGIVNSSVVGSLSFASGGTYIHSQNAGTVPNADWNNNSNCNITGVTTTLPLAGFDQEFGNFTWNCPLQIAAVSFAGNLKRIDGNFTINSTGTGMGRIGLAATQNFNLPVGGNYIQTGGILVLTQTSGNGTLGIVGNYIQTGGTLVLNLNGGVGTLGIVGNYSQTGGTLVLNQNGGDGTLVIGGTFSMSAGQLAKNSTGPASSSTIQFDGSNVHTFTKTGGIITGNINFEVLGGGNIIDFGVSILDGSAATFALRAGAKIITSHPDGLNSSGALGSIQTGGVRFFSINADYEFRGAKTGVFNTRNLTTDPDDPNVPSLVRNLTINNTSGSVTLSKPVTINNPPPNGPVRRLYLQNGALITTATNLLTLNDNAQATGVSPGFQPNNYNLTSFVDGPLKKIGNDVFTFPVGKIGYGLHKIGITAPAAALLTDYFIAEFKRADPKALSNILEDGLVKISACEYWTLDRTGTSQVKVVLSWEANSGCQGSYVTNPLTLRVARLEGNTWMNEGNFSVGGTSVAGVITSGDVITDFSPFALASSSATDNPLPVVFANVKAYEKNNGVQIEWSNLTEKDVAAYTIERSENGRDFNSIGQQLPNSNQNDKADYTAFDPSPFAGINYYRIIAGETTGKIVYSKILSVDMGKEASRGLRLYPNPVSGNQVTFSLSDVKRGQYSLRVINSSGQDVFKQTIINHSRLMTQTLDLPLSLKPGIYNMVVTGKDFHDSKSFIIK